MFSPWIYWNFIRNFTFQLLILWGLNKIYMINSGNLKPWNFCLIEKNNNRKSLDFTAKKGKGRRKLLWLKSGTRRVKGHETQNKAAVVPGSYHQFWVYFTFYFLQKILFGLWNDWILPAYNFMYFLDSFMLHGGSKASLDYEFQNSWCSKITGSNQLTYGLMSCYFILLNAPFL